MQRYAIQWSADLISGAEARLKLVHSVLDQFLSKGLPKATTNASSHQIDPCGSFLLRTTAYSIPYAAIQQDEGVGMDISVQMPESFCSLDDVQNGLYLSKRSEFMDLMKRYFEQQLTKQQGSASVEVESGEAPTKKSGKKSSTSSASSSSLPASLILSLVAFCHDDTKSFLRLQFAADADSSSSPLPFHVHIHARPAQVGARVAALKSAKKHPYYTNLVLEDFSMVDHLKALHASCLSSQNVVKSIVALKCWAAHVGLYNATFPGALTGFAVAAMVQKLLDDHVLSPSMSEENLTRAVLVQIARGVFVHDDLPTLTLQGQESFNVLFRMPLAFMSYIRRQAEETLKLKALQEVFTQRNSPMELQFDVALRLSGLAPVPVNLAGFAKESDRVVYANKVLHILTQALGNRVTPGSLLLWTTGDGHAMLLFNVISEVEGRKPLTVGPAIEETEAVKSFDAFWGTERTTTRQFPDGTIHRCVMWSTLDGTALNTSSTTTVLPVSTVVRHICTVALEKHLSKSASVDVLLGNLEGSLFEKIGQEWVDAVPLTASALRTACGKVDELMHALPAAGAPCKILSFDIISAAERHCETFAIRPHLALLRTSDPIPTAVSCSPTIEPIHCVLNIDDKNRIPDTIEAIAMMKGAISAQLHKAIAQFASTSKDPIIQRMRTFAGTHAVDLIANGFLFRVYIAHYREVSLLKALMKEGEAAALERKLFWTAQHSKCIRGISQGHPSYGPATRLAKRWIAAMLLSGFVLPEAVELLVAHAYLTDAAPKTTTLGFIRFLQLLGDHDWCRPLVLPTVDASEVPHAIAADSNIDGIFIATPYCPAESPFTRHTPKAMIVHRIVGLARSALRTIASLLRTGPSGGVVEELLEASLFTTSDADFDVVLRLAPELSLLPDRSLSIRQAEQMAAEARAVRRIWRLDELSEAESQKYIQQLAELDPAADCVQMLRGNTRDKGMLFVDGCAPTKVAAVLLHPTPNPKHIDELRNVLLKLGKGALLAPPAVVNAPNHTTKKAEEKSAKKKPAAETPTPAKKNAPKEQAANGSAASPSTARTSQVAEEEPRSVGKQGAKRERESASPNSAQAKRPRTESASPAGKGTPKRK